MSPNKLQKVRNI